MDVQRYTKSIAFSTVIAGSMKVCNFLINQFSLRYVDPSSLGRQSYKLDLFYASIQQLSKDSVGLACLSGKLSSQQSVNFAYLAIPLNVITILITRIALIGRADYDDDYNLALALYTLSIALEALVEPLKYQSIRRVQVKKKSFVDSIAFAAKSVVTFALLTQYSAAHALTCYAIGQLGYSIIQFGGYITDISTIYPRRLVNEDVFDQSSIRSLRALTTQALIKLGLTQGDKYIISAHLSDTDQGAFALADNYGSMIARIVFLPIEENSRVYFSNNKSSEQFSLVLGLLLHIYSLLLVILPAFIPNYAQTLLQILLPGYANSNAASILPHYSVYIPFMAFNGILESYLHSTASSSQIDRHSKFLTMLSLTLMPSIYFALKHTPSTYHSLIIVYTNIANLGLRSVYAYRYGSRALNIPSIFPSKFVALACVVAGVVTRFSMSSCSLISHIITGGICALTIFLIIFLTECEWFTSTLNQISVYSNDKKSE